jgi:hypothetical protein
MAAAFGAQAPALLNSQPKLKLVYGTLFQFDLSRSDHFMDAIEVFYNIRDHVSQEATVVRKMLKHSSILHSISKESASLSTVGSFHRSKRKHIDQTPFQENQASFGPNDIASSLSGLVQPSSIRVWDERKEIFVGGGSPSVSADSESQATVFFGVTNTNETVFIKVLPELAQETVFLRRFSGLPGFPEVIKCVRKDKHEIVVVRDAGPTLPFLLLSPEQVYSIVLQLLFVLQRLHAESIVHRDLKPSNMCFSSAGRLTLIDFGALVQLDSTGMTRGVLGTPGFMAPEVTNGGSYSKPADMFSVGLVVLFLLRRVSGNLNSSAGSVLQSLAQNLTQVDPSRRYSVASAIHMLTSQVWFFFVPIALLVA